MKKHVTILRILYPIWAIVGMFGILYVPAELITWDNAVHTAEAVRTHELLYRVGVLGRLCAQLIGIVAAFYLYHLFKYEQKETALWMLILALVGIPIAMLNELNFLGALALLDDPDQMLLLLHLGKQGMLIASVFWGLWLLPLGHLIYRSALFPAWVGSVVIVAGVGYLLSFCVQLVFPEWTHVKDIVEVLTFGEVVWMLWVMIRGAKWPTEN